jgi:hypothetical protein
MAGWKFCFTWFWMLRFWIWQKQIRPAWRAIIFFRLAVRGGPCEPGNLDASTGPAHGPPLRAPDAGADTFLVLGVKKKQCCVTLTGAMFDGSLSEWDVF